MRDLLVIVRKWDKKPTDNKIEDKGSYECYN